MSPENRTLVGKSLVAVANVTAATIFAAGMVETVDAYAPCAGENGISTYLDTKTGHLDSATPEPSAEPYHATSPVDSFNVPAPLEPYHAPAQSNECA